MIPINLNPAYIIDELETIRKATKRTKRQMAKACGVSASTYTRWIIGNASPDVQSMRQIHFFMQRYEEDTRTLPHAQEGPTEFEVKNMGVRMENVGGVVRMDPILHDASASLPPSGMHTYRNDKGELVRVENMNAALMCHQCKHWDKEETDDPCNHCERGSGDTDILMWEPAVKMEVVTTPSPKQYEDTIKAARDEVRHLDLNGGWKTVVPPPPEAKIPESTQRKADVLREICDEEIATFIKKNTDYGDSFANLRRTLPNAVLVRIYDKWSRLASLMNSGDAPRVEESIDDTLADLANYANMELLERRMERMV